MRGPSYSGRVLGGRYAVGELLGEGGWGAVYAAVQTDLGRKVALKILHLDVAITAEAVSRFEREAKAAAALGHPNIVQVTDFYPGAPNEPPFLVMELLTGATLGTILKRQVVLPPSRVASVAFQMLSALDVAHRAGIVHRDVKPDNVFLVSMPGIDDFVKLLDFGIAKLSAESVAQLTGEGQMLGSPAFMSPEQVRSLPIDHRADLYAVAATMYFALAGRLPFDATNVAALLSAILEQRPTPLAVVAPGVDPRLGALVERALHKDPNGRFASAADMRAALEPWVVAGGGVTPITMQAPPTRGSAVSPLGFTGPPGSTATSPPRATHAPSGPPTTMQSPGSPGPYAPAGYTPSAAQPRAPTGTSGAIIALLVAIVALLVLGGLGAAGAVFYFAQKGTATASPIPSASAAVTSSSTAPIASASATPTTTATAVAKSGATRIAPGPTPPSPVPAPVTVDAGGGRVATVDAGTKKQWAGATPRYGGGTFGKYDLAKSRLEIERILPQLSVCYAATEFEPPDHQFTYWTLTIDPSGRVTSARRSTDFEPHAKLDACVIPILKTMKWEALPGGGTPQISLTARTRDNP
ncbi:MAG: serine/threonine protein kinase [Labilithrix sp.]|nr:serine/threonine protein kinase [Labilithrix sp.]